MFEAQTSGWMERAVVARDNGRFAPASHRRALIDLEGAISRLMRAVRGKARDLLDLADRDFSGLGINRQRLVSLEMRSAEARWAAYDPRLPRVANTNQRRDRVA